MKNVVMYSRKLLLTKISSTHYKVRKTLTVVGVQMLKSVDVFNVFWNIEGFRNVVMYFVEYLSILI